MSLVDDRAVLSLGIIHQNVHLVAGEFALYLLPVLRLRILYEEEIKMIQYILLHIIQIIVHLFVLELHPYFLKPGCDERGGMLLLQLINLLIQGCCIYLDLAEHIIKLVHVAEVSDSPAFIFLLGQLFLVHHIPELVQGNRVAVVDRVELRSLVRLLLGSYKGKMILVQPSLEIIPELVVLVLVEIEYLGLLAFENLVLGLDAQLLSCQCYEVPYSLLELYSFSLLEVENVR